jgi:hypothetical protein
MENAPIISISASRVQPEHRERFYQWVYEAYYPLRMKTPALKGIDAYRIVTENPEYNLSMSISQFGSLNDLENAYNSPDWIATSRDRDKSYLQTALGERFWQVAYKQMKGFTNAQRNTPSDHREGPGESPVIHLEGYRLAPDEEERFDAWFTRWGYEVHIPLLMELPSLTQYTLYRYSPVNIPDADRTKRYVEYPSFLSILTFEDISSFENYEQSLELAAYRAGLTAYFRKDLDFRWYVQYRLMRSWRK